MKKHETGRRHTHDTRLSTALFTATVADASTGDIELSFKQLGIGVQIERSQDMFSWHYSSQAEITLLVYLYYGDSALYNYIAGPLTRNHPKTS